MSESGGGSPPGQPGWGPPQGPGPQGPGGQQPGPPTQGWGAPPPGAAAPPPRTSPPPAGQQPPPQPGAPPGAYGAPAGYGAPGGAAGAAKALTSKPTALVSAAIALAFVLAVIGDIVAAFQKQATIGKNGLPVEQLLQIKGNTLQGRDRFLQVFDFGSLVWAVALLIALVVLLAGPRLLGSAEGAGRPGGRPEHGPLAVVLAGFSALVALAAVVDLVVYFTYFGKSFSLGAHGVLSEVGTAVIALATVWWAFSASGMQSRRPSAPTAPPQAAWGPGSQTPTTGFQAPPGPGGYAPPGGGYPPQ